MKILTVSDKVEPFLYQQADLQQFKGTDLIISCGDLPPEYLTYLTAALNAPLLYVRGNHDIRYRTKPPEGCIDLHARVYTFQGLRLLGLEGSRWYNGGPNQYREHQMKHLIRKLRPRIWWQRGLDIIVTHAPPRHIHDAEDRCHKGFNTYRKLIQKYAPQYFIHGHIHALFEDRSQRITTINQTKVVNSYGHFLFEIDIRSKAQKGPDR